MYDGLKLREKNPQHRWKRQEKIEIATKNLTTKIIFYS